MSSTTMGTDSDAFLNEFDFNSLVDGGAQVADGGLESASGSGASSTFGSNAGPGGTPTQFGDFDLGGTLNQQGSMDLGDFNIFGDKANDGRRGDNAMPPSAGSAQGNANNVNFDALQQLLSMQMQYPMSVDGTPGSSQAGTSNNTNTAVLIEQQLRLNQLQQLQQLQNQIFQQQIELISGQSSLSNSLEPTPLPTPAFRDTNQFQGLPTPVNSTELRPQPPPNFVSPMILQNYLAQPGPATQFNTPHPLPQGPSSAPAHLAFSTQAPLLSPGDLDFELSPLTSPWLGAVSYQQAQQQAQQQSQNRTQNLPKRRGSKRGASSSGDDASGQARKRQSSAIRATAGGARKAAVMRGSASVSSTPAIRPRSSRNSVTGDVVGDTPSPVDLSMPPPAPPTQPSHNTVAGTQPPAPASSGSPATSPALSPVTPASIMNLGRLGLSSGLSPPLNAVEDQDQHNLEKSKGKGKSKTPPKTSTSGPTKSIAKKASSTSLISPSLKPLLPGGLAPSSAAHLGSASNYTHHLSGSAAALHIAPATPLPPPAPAVRKTSHKAAEQKRRDSLKTSFDALRLLLPPLPLPSDENYVGEAPLPGAMPPRGPPRGDVAGPNRAVSKLQLLRCGNDFIRRLQARVARRDEYIEQLKAEVRVLRARAEAKEAGVDAVAAEIEKVDLEKDIDAEEENAPRLGGALLEGDEADEEYE